MTSNHVLALLTLLAAGLLLTALGLSAAGLRLPVVAWPEFNLGGITLPAISLPSGTGLPHDTSLLLQLALGFVAGWTLRWIYSLPWAALPRAVIEWLLGWRRSATMLSLALGCTAVLLLY